MEKRFSYLANFDRKPPILIRLGSFEKMEADMFVYPGIWKDTPYLNDIRVGKGCFMDYDDISEESARKIREELQALFDSKAAEEDPDREWKGTGHLSFLDRAVEFAAVKHAGQFRKGTRIPYLTHVVEAMEIVSHLTEEEEMRAAAVLHDTLEDTETTKDELAENFGKRVADLVAAENENKREGQPEKDTWKTRKEETIRHLSSSDTEIRMLALGDKLSNMRALHRDYEAIGEELWQRFNQRDPVKHGWYYGSLANIFGEDEEIRETQEYKEYVSLCRDLFGRTDNVQ